MDEEVTNIGDVTREDVTDIIQDGESESVLSLLSEYYFGLNGKNPAPEARVKNAIECATMLYKGKRYEDTIAWLDDIATQISDEEGPESDAYVLFTEDPDLETLRMDATDRIFGGDEEEGMDDDDEFDDE